MPTLTLTPAPTIQSTGIACSESLPCSESLACGETGTVLADVGTTTLTLTPVSP